MSASKARTKRTVKRAAIWLLIALTTALVLPPILWVISTSLKYETDTVSYPPVWVPDPLSFVSYANIWTSTNIRFFLNSTILAAGSIVLALAISLPTAYVVTRFRGRAMESFATGLTVLSMVPGVVVFIALYSMFVKTSLMNSYPLLILVYTGMITGQTIIFLRSFIENIPIEMEEAASVDGASRFQIFTRVVLPLMKPGIAAIAIFIFVFVWNDYLVSTVLATTESMKTVQNGIVRYITTGFGNFWGLFSAFVVVAFLPVLGVFVAFQRWFIAGITSGGVKG